MEYNFLLVEGQNLLYENKSKLCSLNKESLEKLTEEYTLISNKIPQENSLVSEITNLVKNNETVVSFEKVTSALKEIDNDQIVSHLKREDYRKISYPIITRTEHIKKYLIKYSYLFSVDTFLSTSSFQGVELDSWYQ
jgi:heme-binding NEAT domain protein